MDRRRDVGVGETLELRHATTTTTAAIVTRVSFQYRVERAREKNASRWAVPTNRRSRFSTRGAVARYVHTQKQPLSFTPLQDERWVSRFGTAQRKYTETLSDRRSGIRRRNKSTGGMKDWSRNDFVIGANFRLLYENFSNISLLMVRLLKTFGWISSPDPL